MELISIYFSIILFFGSLAEKDERIFSTVAVIVAASVWLALFLLQGTGLYILAKRRGMKRKGLAFVPFASVYYLGRIAGKCDFFGQKMKNVGLYAMIVEILAGIVGALFIFCHWYLLFHYGSSINEETGAYFGKELVGFSAIVETTYGIAIAISLFTYMFALMFMSVLLGGVFKKYAPASYRLYSLLFFVFPPSRYIMVFAIRNKEEINFEEYIRKLQEAYIRRQQQYHNTYGNPYNNPYGRPYGGQQTPPYSPPSQPEDPFDEFSSKSEKPKEENRTGEDPDEFFN